MLREGGTDWSREIRIPDRPPPPAVISLTTIQATVMPAEAQGLEPPADPPEPAPGERGMTGENSGPLDNQRTHACAADRPPGRQPSSAHYGHTLLHPASLIPAGTGRQPVTKTIHGQSPTPDLSEPSR